MVTKVKFWLLEISSSICKALLSVMVLQSLFLHSLFTTEPFFRRKATPPPWPVERSFLIVSIITWNFEIVLFAEECFI